jgi:hypothetical protein
LAPNLVQTWLQTLVEPTENTIFKIADIEHKRARGVKVFGDRRNITT